MASQWTRDEVLQLARSFQPACVITAAADLNVFSALSGQPMTATGLAGELKADSRAMAVLLDALVAMELLDKSGTQYRVPPDVAEALTERGGDSVLPMVRHNANCLRRWAQLARIVKSGRPAEREPSIRGEAADQESFIGGMHNVFMQRGEQVVSELGPLSFGHLLDVGGGSGSWTISLLRAVPEATATIFDLPEVIPMAEARIADAGLSKRVKFVGGDFYVDALPAGAELVWLSAIAHQNSREQNRELFGKIYEAMNDGGVLVIRDVVMDESRTQPAAGAMFAVNMLVATEGGGTYTFDEYREDLTAAGFEEITLLRQDEFMDSIIRARRPARN